MPDPMRNPLPYDCTGFSLPSAYVRHHRVLVAAMLSSTQPDKLERRSADFLLPFDVAFSWLNNKKLAF